MWMTGEAVAGDLVGQGTAGASLVSQLNLDRGLQQYLAGSAEETYYGRERIEYTAYQDDVGKPSRGVREAQGNTWSSWLTCARTRHATSTSRGARATRPGRRGSWRRSP